MQAASLHSRVLEYMGQGFQPQDLAKLNLSDRSMQRLYRLLEAQKERKLNFREKAQLEAFYEAAVYARMGAAD